MPRDERRATPRNYSATARKHSAIPQIWRTAVDLILEHQQSYHDQRSPAEHVFVARILSPG